tara:strand:+ start:565 stop:1887 length:1323 start_codon:yes stop_codon:yes gene_type:complete
MKILNKFKYLVLLILFISCKESSKKSEGIKLISIPITDYQNSLEGFWLGQSIANWTGLVTEMDKIGIPSIDGKGEGFYTRNNWRKMDQPNIWGEYKGGKNQLIDFKVAEKDSIWGSDDDTDIEYMYQELLYNIPYVYFTPEQIVTAWKKHIYVEEENYLWVSNQKAFDLMNEGIFPPQTSDPVLNPFYEMIDAQLTTEVFGLFAPTNPKVALDIAYLPIRTTAAGNAVEIAEFYVIMHSLASNPTTNMTIKDRIHLIANQAREHLNDENYPAKMYDFVFNEYKKGTPWETTRNLLNKKYQINQEDGYSWPSKDKDCSGCFAAGINFGASIISLFYGEGDFKNTIKIGSLTGWDSDNPTSTWGGLLGFMLGKNEIERIMGRPLSNKYNIHRTRKGFDNNGIDTFENMAQKGVSIVNKIALIKMGGFNDKKNNRWILPIPQN